MGQQQQGGLREEVRGTERTAKRGTAVNASAMWAVVWLLVALGLGGGVVLAALGVRLVCR